MIGAVIGDIVGSRFEFCGIKTKHFDLLDPNCFFTDDTVMTAAVAKALMALGKEIISKPAENRLKIETALISQMRSFGKKYPNAGYGTRFSLWLRAKQPKPYGSFGNGSAMRVSPCALAANSIQNALELAEISASVTHNHPEGVKGAKAVAAAVYLARHGSSKAQIKEFIESYFYKFDFTLAKIRPGYSFNETCQGSVPEAIEAFLESTSFEDALRNAVSLGGDSDTIAAITGSIAFAFFDRDRSSRLGDAVLIRRAQYCLTPELRKIVRDFEEFIKE